MASMSQIASSSSSSPSSLPSKQLPSKLDSPESEANSGVGLWPDLPDYLAENILERLPISDYISFAAVCQQWRSIQQNHRRRHDPSPPPMLNLPWFVPCQPQPQRQQEPVDCFSPFEHRSHRIRLPLSRRYLEFGSESRDGRSWHSCEPNGWLVLDDGSVYRQCGEYCKYYLTLLNPISGVQIELPGLRHSMYWRWRLSVSPPPGCFVFLAAYDRWGLHILLFREWDARWSELDFPDSNMPQDASLEDASLEETSAIVWEGKVYYMYWGRGLMVIDPLPIDPTIEFLEMDQSQLPTQKHGWGEDDMFRNFRYLEVLFLVESNGKMLLVVKGSVHYSYTDKDVVRFQVFEADFSNKRWVRLESLGDRVLFIHQRFVCSLFADDIGAEGNCIYFTDPYKIEESSHQNSSRVGPIPWNVFNLGTGKLIESPLLYAPTSDTLMFVPSLS